MRGRNLCVLFMILFLSLSLQVPIASGQSRSEKEVIIGTPMNDLARDMVIDSSGNVVVVGRSEHSVDPWSGEFYAVKVSSDGETLWTKSWNTSSDDILVSVAVDSSDNLLMTGVSNLNNEGPRAGVIYKLNPEGEILWSTSIENLSYSWWWMGSWSFSAFCFDIEMHPESDDFFIVGSLKNGSNKTFVARYNSSGSLIWRTDWNRSSQSLGNIASQTWVSSQNLIVVSGLLYSNIEPYIFYPYDGQFLAAFDFDGNLIWNYTSYEPMIDLRESSASFEISPDDYLYATTAGRNFDHVVRRTYDLNNTWSFDVIVGEYLSVVISGFTANGTNNLIGYGEVISLQVGKSVTKSYRPAYQAPQPPQTLIFSFSSDGELLWYDFLVMGRVSDPCGCQFDSDGRLIVAGHTSPWALDTNDFYIVFGFVQTPFPVHFDSLAVYLFPVFNLIALGSIWTFTRRKSGNIESPQESKPRVSLHGAVRTFLIIEVVLYIVLYSFLGGLFWSGIGPSPLVYYPDWVAYALYGMFYGLLILLIAHLAIWLRKEVLRTS